MKNFINLLFIKKNKIQIINLCLSIYSIYYHMNIDTLFYKQVMYKIDKLDNKINMIQNNKINNN